VIVGVRQWGEEHYYAKGKTHSKRIDRKNIEPVRKLELRAKDGRLLGASDPTRLMPD
jgi:hypothetical protein